MRVMARRYATMVVDDGPQTARRTGLPGWARGVDFRRS
jgi:hypothetical protein